MRPPKKSKELIAKLRAQYGHVLGFRIVRGGIEVYTTLPAEEEEIMSKLCEAATRIFLGAEESHAVGNSDAVCTEPTTTYVASGTNQTV